MHFSSVTFLTILSIFSYGHVYAVKVIQWPAHEELSEGSTTPNDLVSAGPETAGTDQAGVSNMEAEMVAEPVPPELEVNTAHATEATEIRVESSDIITNTDNGLFSENLVDRMEIDPLPEPSNLADQVGVDNAESVAAEITATPSTPSTPKTPKKTFRIKSSDFQGTLLYDLMQTENGRVLVSAFLNAFSHTIANGVSSNMYLHMSRHIKNLLKDPKGSKSISIISSTLTTLLTDERASKRFHVMLEHFKWTTTQPETTIFMGKVNALASSLLAHKKSVQVTQVFASEIISLLELPDPKNAIIDGFRTLRSFTWPETDPIQTDSLK